MLSLTLFIILSVSSWNVKLILSLDIVEMMIVIIRSIRILQILQFFTPVMAVQTGLPTSQSMECVSAPVWFADSNYIDHTDHPHVKLGWVNTTDHDSCLKFCWVKVGSWDFKQAHWNQKSYMRLWGDQKHETLVC